MGVDRYAATEYYVIGGGKEPREARKGDNMTKIHVRYDEVALFGSEFEELSSEAREANRAAYESSLARYLSELYGSSEVEIVEGPGPAEYFLNGEDSEELQRDCEEHWSRQDWWV